MQVSTVTFCLKMEPYSCPNGLQKGFLIFPHFPQNMYEFRPAWAYFKIFKQTSKTICLAWSFVCMWPWFTSYKSTLIFAAFLIRKMKVTYLTYRVTELHLWQILWPFEKLGISRRVSDLPSVVGSKNKSIIQFRNVWSTKSSKLPGSPHITNVNNCK